MGIRKYIMKGELGEGRARWITNINQYDIEVKPIKVVKGRYFCQELAIDFIAEPLLFKE